MSNTDATTLTHSTGPQAPDYTVPDPKEAWERMNRLVSKVMNTSLSSPASDTKGTESDNQERLKND